MSSIILQAHSLTKKYRHTVALDHIDLQIEKGKIYGFIGQNGAGKTTFLRLVTGLAFPTSGTLDLWGKSSAKDLHLIVVGENRRKGIAGTEKADRLHDRNTCAFSDNDRLSKYGDTTHPTRHPR